jgi:hypothetical protein
MILVLTQVVEGSRCPRQLPLWVKSSPAGHAGTTAEVPQIEDGIAAPRKSTVPGQEQTQSRFVLSSKDEPSLRALEHQFKDQTA